MSLRLLPLLSLVEASSSFASYTGLPPVYGSREADLCVGFFYDKCRPECEEVHRCMRPVVSLTAGEGDVEYDSDQKAISNGDKLRERARGCAAVSQLLASCMKQENSSSSRYLYVLTLVWAAAWIICIKLYRSVKTVHINDEVIDEELDLMCVARTNGRLEGEEVPEGLAIASAIAGNNSANAFSGTYTIDGVDHDLKHESAFYSVNCDKNTGRIFGEGDHPQDGFFSFEGHVWRDGSNKIAWREAYDKHVFRGKTCAESFICEVVGKIDPSSLEISGVWLTSVDSRGAIDLGKTDYVVDKKALLNELAEKEVQELRIRGAKKSQQEDNNDEEENNNGTNSAELAANELGDINDEIARQESV